MSHISVFITYYLCNNEHSKHSNAPGRSFLYHYLLGDCDVGWLELETSCYYITDDSNTKRWNDAVTYCESLNALLVIIESATENDFLHQNTPAGENYWAGGTDKYQGK